MAAPFSPAAHAGSYAVAYTCSDPTYSVYGGAEGKVVSAMTVAPNSQTLNSTITATLTWVPDPNIPNDQPPAALIVAQDSRVGWNSDNPSDSGHLDTGLSGTGITSGGSIISNRKGEEPVTHWAEQTQTQVISNPNKVVTLTCTPTTKVTSTYEGNLTVCVDYKVTSANISLKVTTPDANGKANIMVGQVCTASIAAGPTGGPSITADQWSVSGIIYQNWTPGIAPVAGLSSATTPTETWWWDDLNKTPETVQCVVTVAGAQYTLSQPVIVQVPAVDPPNIQPGTVYINVNCPNQHGALFMYAGGPGMSILASFSTPAPFGPGTMELVQTWTPGDSYKTADGKQHYDPNSGLTGLDTQYPYAGSEQAEPNYANNDNPGDPLLPYMNSLVLDHTFTDWLMYEPPDAGNGRYYVPRKTFGWQVTSNLLVTQPSGGWIDEGPTSYGSVTITPACTDTNQYPTWPQTITPAALPWPAGP